MKKNIMIGVINSVVEERVKRGVMEAMVPVEYLEAVKNAGADAIIISQPISNIDNILEIVDGLVFTGGPDIDPILYQQKKTTYLEDVVNKEVDMFQLKIFNAAVKKGLPILGICRGMQLINVARGGSLHQHIPASYITDITHRQKEIGSKAAHTVSVAKNSKLGGIIGQEDFRVNSFHHQGVDKLGEGLVITGSSKDGVVEALEDPSSDFLIGVQWHVEAMHTSTSKKIWKAFVNAAST